MNSACRSAGSTTASTRMRSGCGTPTSRKAFASPRPPAPGKCGRRAATCRPSTSWAAPSWAPTRATRWSTATGRATSCRTSISPCGHLPHGGRVESDQHDLCPVAARRRAARGEVGGGRALRSARASAFSLLALANLLWAGNWVIGRALRDAFEPVALNFWRWLIAALVLAPFALPELARARATLRRHAGLLALLALAGVAVFQTLVYLGLKTTTAINAVLLNSSAPLFMLLCSWMLERETATRRQLAGMLVSLVGLLLIVSHGPPGQLP